MSTIKRWVVESKQMNPSSFYVKVDGAEAYHAYWAVHAATESDAIEKATAIAEELALGETEVIASYQYSGERPANASVRASMDQAYSNLDEYDDALLGAWCSKNGGVL